MKQAALTTFSVNEQSVRDISHNMKNLFKLAESQNYPFADIQLPSLVTILNAVTKCFGYKSFKGLGIHCKGGAIADVNIKDIKSIDLAHDVYKRNPNLSDKDKFEVQQFIQTLFSQLLTYPLNTTDQEVLARIQVRKMSHLTSQVLCILEYQLYKTEDSIVSDLLKVAQYSNIMYFSGLSSIGLQDQMHVRNLIKYNLEDTLASRVIQWNKCLNSYFETLPNYNISNVISRIHPSNDDVYQAIFNPNQNFVEILKAKLRESLANLLMSELSTQYSGAVMLNHNKARNFNNEILDNRVFESLVKANIKVINKLVGPTDTGLRDLKSFDFDPYGLLLPKTFPIVFDIYKLVQKDKIQFPNMNVFYWVVQLLSVDLLKTENSHWSNVAARYILDIYDVFIPVVQDHFEEVHTEEFKQLLLDVKQQHRFE